jgi:hypothetical protein
MSRPRTAALAALLLAAGCHAWRPSRAPSPERAPDRVWLTGASNIRRFACGSESVRVLLALPAGATVDGILAGDSAAVTAAVAVAVSSLDCGIGQQSKHLHAALGAPAAPTIEFRLASHRLGGDRSGFVGPEVPVRLDGALRIAGTERAVTLAAVVHRDPSGALRLRGEHALRPTDFGVTPPVRFAGLLRVRDAVTVHWDVALRPEPVPPRGADAGR